MSCTALAREFWPRGALAGTTARIPSPPEPSLERPSERACQLRSFPSLAADEPLGFPKALLGPGTALSVQDDPTLGFLAHGRYDFWRGVMPFGSQQTPPDDCAPWEQLVYYNLSTSYPPSIPHAWHPSQERQPALYGNFQEAGHSSLISSNVGYQSLAGQEVQPVETATYASLDFHRATTRGAVSGLQPAPGNTLVESFAS